MVARVAVVFAGFLAYRVMGDEHLLAGVLAWLGMMVAGFPVIDHLTLRRGKRVERSQAGIVAVGVGLVGAAIVVRVT